MKKERKPEYRKARTPKKSVWKESRHIEASGGSLVVKQDRLGTRIRGVIL